MTSESDEDTLTSITIDNNDWDEQNIKIAKKLGNLAAAQNWIHNMTAKFYVYLSYTLQIPIIILASFTVAGPLGTIAEDVDQIYVKVIIALAGAVILCLETLIVYLGLSNKISDQRSAATKYLTIFNTIYKMMNKKPNDRDPAYKFIDEIYDNYTDVNKESPAVLCCAIRAYLKMKPNNIDINYTDLIGIQTVNTRDIETGKSKKRNDHNRRKIRPVNTMLVINGKKRQYELERYFIDC